MSDDLNNTRILDAAVDFIPRSFARPLVLSTGAITDITEARVAVTVRTGTRESTGLGSVYLSDLWAWPAPSVDRAAKDERLREICRRIADHLHDLCGGEPAHPLELGLRLHDSASEGDLPPLARVMCLSPFDAAIHDAAGHALGMSAFEFYDSTVAIPSLDCHFKHGATAAIRALIRNPVRELPAWYIIGKDDNLDLTVRPIVQSRGFRCFKLKLMGRDNAADVARTVEVARALKQYGVQSPRITVDANEANPDAASVLDYLERLEAADGSAYHALEYLEQPTHRDIRAYCYDWRKVSARKPALLDEGVSSWETLPLALEQGWGGLALKTCKGHSFVLAAAAWAREHGLILALQDLTNPGYSLIHAALLGAHVPFVNGVELNSPQFTPEANTEWLPRLAALFEPCDGIHRLPGRIPPGLGSQM